jgi:hypothetical protein
LGGAGEIYWIVWGANAREARVAIGKIQRRIQAVKLEAGCYFRKLIRPHVIQ